MFKKIKVIAVGKNKTDCLDEAISFYSAKINFQAKLEWLYINHSDKKTESQKIISHLEKNLQAYPILLDEKGKSLTSPLFADLLQTQSEQSSSHEVIFIIGGAYGVSKELHDYLRQRPSFIWSLSALVFPHQLVRVILLEQIYRAQSILNGSNYHHL